MALSPAVVIQSDVDNPAPFFLVPPVETNIIGIWIPSLMPGLPHYNFAIDAVEDAAATVGSPTIHDGYATFTAGSHYIRTGLLPTAEFTQYVVGKTAASGADAPNQAVFVSGGWRGNSSVAAGQVSDGDSLHQGIGVISGRNFHRIPDTSSFDPTIISLTQGLTNWKAYAHKGALVGHKLRNLTDGTSTGSDSYERGGGYVRDLSSQENLIGSNINRTNVAPCDIAMVVLRDVYSTTEEDDLIYAWMQDVVDYYCGIPI